MNVRSILSATLFLAGGCFGGAYQNHSDMPDAQQKAYARVEAYYLGKAHDQATFSLNCAPDQVKTKVVSTTPGHVNFNDDAGNWVSIAHAEQIATIGAEGCEQRTSYQVMCGPSQNYGIIDGHSGWKPCDVLPSSEGIHTAEKNHAAEQEEIDAASRRNNETHH
jgi:hypothetical protein